MYKGYKKYQGLYSRKTVTQETVLDQVIGVSSRSRSIVDSVLSFLYHSPMLNKFI